jgi:hypothetical protein
MKKLLTLAFTMLLAASLSFAQTGGSTDKTKGTGKTAETGKKAKTQPASHSKKGGKKSKKSSGSTTTAPK